MSGIKLLNNIKRAIVKISHLPNICYSNPKLNISVFLKKNFCTPMVFFNVVLSLFSRKNEGLFRNV